MQKVPKLLSTASQEGTSEQIYNWENHRIFAPEYEKEMVKLAPKSWKDWEATTAADAISR